MPSAAPKLARREFSLALAAGAAGAGIVLLAAAATMGTCVVRARRRRCRSLASPLLGTNWCPPRTHSGSPRLACLAAVIATRGVVRRVAGVLLALLGVLIAAAATMSVRHAHVAAAAAARSLATAGAPRLTMAAFPWWAAAAVGGLLIVAAGVLAAWRGPRWPGMSGRYDRPGGPPQATGDPAAAWDALDRGTDPTVPRGRQ